MPKTTDTPATVPVVFADKAFKSRTIVLEDGRSFLVEKARISATDPALIEHLDKHGDFNRIDGE